MKIYRVPETGFTLLEIMVAMSIVAIVVTSVLKMHSQTISMNNSAIFHTTAPLLAQKKMAEIELDSINKFTNPSDSDGDFGDRFAGYKWTVSIDDVESDILGSTANDFKKIEVVVIFGNDEYRYAIRAYRFIRN